MGRGGPRGGKWPGPSYRTHSMGSFLNAKNGKEQMALSPTQRSSRFRQRHPERQREMVRDSLRRTRAAAREAKRPAITWPVLPKNQGAAFAKWAAEKLRVPAGHPSAGAAFVLPAYLAAFFSDALAADTQEAAMIIARKNGKSAGVAALLLAFLVGPLRREGWRAGICSINREKAHELKMQVEAIARASNLEGVQFWKRGPQAITSEGGTVDVLSADKHAGAASSYDLSIVDEIGLLTEQDRGLVNSMRSSVSAKRGKFLSLSVFGDGPFCGEIVARRDDDGVCVHVFQAKAGCSLTDPAAWAAANPGLGGSTGGIKSRAYMVSESRRVLSSVADQPSFLAFDLNLPQSPSKEMVCSVSDWSNCTVPKAKLPKREGPCFVGLDAGGAVSMTAAAAYWPQTGLLEVRGAFPSVPDLKARGTKDGAGDSYQTAYDMGELVLFSGMVTPLGDFTRALVSDLAGCDVRSGASDQYRRSEVEQILDAEDVPFPWVWRRMGSGPDGSADTRAFQRAVLRNEIKTAPSLLMPLALKSTVLKRDSNGNPSLHRGGSGARIDVLSACVLAVGLSAASAAGDGFWVSSRPIQ